MTSHTGICGKYIDPGYASKKVKSSRLSGHIHIHKDKMADAAAHDKQVEDLMGAEIFVVGVEEGELQCVDHTAHSVDDASCQQPQEGGGGQSVKQLAEHQDADPAHGDIDQGGKPFGTSDPESLDQHTNNSDAPDQGQHGIAQRTAQNDQAYRRIGTGD